MRLRLTSHWPLALLLTAALPSQESLPDLRTLVPLDRVVATINDAVILDSEIQTLAVGQARSMELQIGRQLIPAEWAQIRNDNLRQKINQHTLAQAAKTLGIRKPEEVEQWFQDELRREEAQMRRQLGSYQKLSEELARQNQTWQAFEREKRVSVLADMARWMAVNNRLQNQRNLFITPRMMRLYYRANRNLFVHDSRALVGGLSFTGAKALTEAKKAAEAWRETALRPEEMIARLGQPNSVVAENIQVDERNKDSLRPELAEFGGTGPLGRVSDPVRFGNSYKVWKIMAFEPSRSDRFDSPAVQRDIRSRLENQVMDQLLDQTIRRARTRTHVWRPSQ